MLAEPGHEVVGADLAGDMLPRARAEADRRGVRVDGHRCAADRVDALAPDARLTAASVLALRATAPAGGPGATVGTR